MVCNDILIVGLWLKHGNALVRKAIMITDHQQYDECIENYLMFLNMNV